MPIYTDDEIRNMKKIVCKIAGVFKNHLDKNMILGSNITICYALYEYDKPEDFETNVGIDSPYNIYIYPRLLIALF